MSICRVDISCCTYRIVKWNAQIIQCWYRNIGTPRRWIAGAAEEHLRHGCAIGRFEFIFAGAFQ